jgi:ABC-type multidrug transport system fused ATPase/permease subunit
MQNRTSVIIAHRLATIRDVDCIYVLDRGKIVEKGTHAELIAHEDGIYHNLAKLQFGLSSTSDS